MRFIRLILRLLGALLVLAALAVVGTEIAAFVDTRSYTPKAAGEVWYALHPNSLQLAQPAVQRYISPALWERVIQPLLLLPASVVLVAIGAALIGLSLLRRRQRMRFRRRW